MVEEHRIKTTYETESGTDASGVWTEILRQLTPPEDPVWEMVEYRLKCSYCGMKTRESIRDGDVDSTLREHAKTCSEHPLRELEEEIKVLKKMLQKHYPPVQEAIIPIIKKKPSKKVRRKKKVVKRGKG